MTSIIRCNAYAKLNWYLDVVGQRADGYHLLDMINQQIALHDSLEIAAADALTLSASGSIAVPTGSDNLIIRAAQALQRSAGIYRGAHIKLTKRIPTGAGLGGGSADAAATLIALNELWAIGLGKHNLMEIGASLGADISYCLTGGLQRVQGIGEQLHPIKDTVPSFPLIIIKPRTSLATKEVFAAYSPATDPAPVHSAEVVVAALASSNFDLLSKAAGNRLQPAAIRLVPQVEEAIDDLYQSGADFAQMTGSGSAVFGVFASNEVRGTAMKKLHGQYELCIETATLAY